MTKRHFRPSFTAADSVMRQWLDCGAPQVTSVSAPLAIASATRNSSLRVLLPPGKSPSMSSRLIQMRGPWPPGQLAASASLKRGRNSSGVVKGVYRRRGNLERSMGRLLRKCGECLNHFGWRLDQLDQHALAADGRFLAAPGVDEADVEARRTAANAARREAHAARLQPVD